MQIIHSIKALKAKDKDKAITNQKLVGDHNVPFDVDGIIYR